MRQKQADVAALPGAVLGPGRNGVLDLVGLQVHHDGVHLDEQRVGQVPDQFPDARDVEAVIQRSRPNS